MSDYASELLLWIFYLLFKTFINHICGLDESVRRAGLGPQTVVWRHLTQVTGKSTALLCCQCVLYSLEAHSYYVIYCLVTEHLILTKLWKNCYTEVITVLLCVINRCPYLILQVSLLVYLSTMIYIKLCFKRKNNEILSL